LPEWVPGVPAASSEEQLEIMSELADLAERQRISVTEDIFRRC
jgi:hypothetical protein